MKWMREYKNLSELVIRVMNKYSYLHNKQFKFDNEHSISFSEAQILEEIFRNKDSNLTRLANELGVTKAAISKTMKKLELKGYISRYKQHSNKKEIFVSITDLGKKIYNKYQNYIYENLFKEIFQLLDNNEKTKCDFLEQFFHISDRSFHKLTKENFHK